MTDVLAYDSIPFPEEAGVFLACCHLMVANAVEDEESRRDRDIDTSLAEVGLDAAVDYRAEVIRFGEQVPEEWLPAVVALMTVDSPFFTTVEMTGGVINRRVNAILDVVGAPYCAHDMQGFFGQLIEMVDDAARDPKKAAVAGFTRLAAAFGAGFFGQPGAAPMAANAVDWLFEDSGDLPTSVLEASKMALCYEELLRAGTSETESEAAVRLAVGGTAYELAVQIADRGSAASGELKRAHRAWYGTYVLLGGDKEAAMEEDSTGRHISPMTDGSSL